MNKMQEPWQKLYIPLLIEEQDFLLGENDYKKFCILVLNTTNNFDLKEVTITPGFQNIRVVGYHENVA